MLKPSLRQLSFGEMSLSFVKYLVSDNCTRFSETAYLYVPFKRV